MIPSTVTLDSLVRGDTWPGFRVQITINGSKPANDLSSVLMHFRTAKDAPGNPSLALTSSSGITINDADLWDVTVNSQILALAAGVWFWDMQFTDVAGNVNTYIEGRLLIVQDVSRV